jgi:YggT family protein
MLALASVRTTASSYVATLITVYIVIIFLHILLQLLFSFGLRPPYSRAGDAVLGFLRDVSEPYLRIFRKFIPAIGMLDLSPMVAIIVLVILQRVLVRVIGG